MVEPEEFLDQLRTLKSANVDGVMVDCWWGIVEAHTPQVYNWSGYKKLFKMIHELGLKIQVLIMSHTLKFVFLISLFVYVRLHRRSLVCLLEINEVSIQFSGMICRLEINLN